MKFEETPLFLLIEHVTPAVVDHSQLEIDIDKKASLLKQFYPIMLGIFYKFPERFKQIQTQGDSLTALPLDELCKHQSSVKEQLLQGFAKHHSLVTATIESLFNRAIILSVQVLEQRSEHHTIQEYLQPSMSITGAQMPAWSAAILSSLGIEALLNTQTASIDYEKNSSKQESGKKWMPWIGLIIILILGLLMWRSCQQPSAPYSISGQGHEPRPVSAPSESKQ